MKINITELHKRYGEPHRHYHNWYHVLSMINSLFELNTKSTIGLVPKETSALVKAIVFHDVIYDVIPNTIASNEQRSALYFLQSVVGQDPSELDTTLSLIKNLILATEYHFSEHNPIWDSMSEREIYLSKIMLDLDLMSFSLPYERFVKVNEQIRQEYETYFSEEVVTKGRKEFLESILNNRSLHYYILPDREEREAVAYANIEKYLSEMV